MIKNPDEIIAARYLEVAGFVPCHEPNGNSKFPDFSICSNKIGVEVRRVSWMIEALSPEPLETAQTSLWEHTSGVLAEFVREDLPTSFIVRLKFKRPLPPWLKVKKAVERHLDKPFRELPCRSHQILDNVWISVIQCEQRRQNAFLFGGNSDLDNGGFVVASMIEGIVKSIEAKTLTEKKSRNHGFDHLWLMLVNRMDPHLTRDEIADIAGEVRLSGPWERIFLLSPDAKMLAEWTTTPPAR